MTKKKWVDKKERKTKKKGKNREIMINNGKKDY